MGKSNNPENERFTLKLTDEERTTMTNRLKEGYYRPEAVQTRKDYEAKVTEEDFNKFVSSVDRSLLPDGITIKMK